MLEERFGKGLGSDGVFLVAVFFLGRALFSLADEGICGGVFFCVDCVLCWAVFDIRVFVRVS